MTEQLKPCPFCGSEPHDAHHIEYGRWAVTCNCGVMGACANTGPNASDAAKIKAYNDARHAWNTRALTTSQPAPATRIWINHDLRDVSVREQDEPGWVEFEVHTGIISAQATPEPASKHRPSPEWYAAMIKETMDDDFVIGPAFQPATPPQQAAGEPVGERWVVVRETALDVGEGNDARTGGRPELGYALISDAATFGSEDEAVAAIKNASLPVGWVVLPLSRLLPDLGAAHPAPGVPEDVQRDAERYRAINTPEIKDFLAAVHNEALHQRERWGSEQDAGKTDADWFWLLGYLAGKAIHAQTDEKRLHHIITTAAACLNWHAARVGAWASMRPGIDPAAHGLAAAQAKGADPEDLAAAGVMLMGRRADHA